MTPLRARRGPASFAYRLPSFARVLAVLGLLVGARAVADPPPPSGDPAQGKIMFQQSCALCHADSLAPGDAAIVREGPSLVGVLGRRAGANADFQYTPALAGSGLTWDAATLDRFLVNPAAVVPGTTMPISVADPKTRADIIAYLATLKFPSRNSASPAGP